MEGGDGCKVDYQRASTVELKVIFLINLYDILMAIMSPRLCVRYLSPKLHHWTGMELPHESVENKTTKKYRKFQRVLEEFASRRRQYILTDRELFSRFRLQICWLDSTEDGNTCMG